MSRVRDIEVGADWHEISHNYLVEKFDHIFLAIETLTIEISKLREEIKREVK